MTFIDASDPEALAGIVMHAIDTNHGRPTYNIAQEVIHELLEFDEQVRLTSDDLLPALCRVLSAYRSTSAHVTEEEITAAWAELDAIRRQLRTEGRVSRAWPVLHRWAAGHLVAGPALVLELRDALGHFGGADGDASRNKQNSEEGR